MLDSDTPSGLRTPGPGRKHRTRGQRHGKYSSAIGAALELFVPFLPIFLIASGAALGFSVVQLACIQHQGDFAILASRPNHSTLDRTYTWSPERTSGRACFSLIGALLGLPDDAVMRATREAMEQVPEADVLLLVELKDHGACVEVSGFPTRFD